MIELSISGANVFPQAVADLLCSLSVEASIFPTINVVKSSDGSFSQEQGACIVFPDCDRTTFASKVWPALREAFSLQCGYMDASTPGYRGCTENFIRESACPHRKSSEPPECK